MNQVKSHLPQLLATENIKVEHQDIPTAYFDLKNRVLGLPNWKDMSKDVYDLLVGHEVSHALYTPQVSLKELGAKLDPDNADAVGSFYNIVEDVRIEKKIKSKFKGLRKCMYRGYKELFEKDIFQLKDKSVEDLGFIDRINLHFKIGNLVDIPFFSDEELEFVKRIDRCDTFEDVERVVKDLYNFVQERGELNDFQQPPTFGPNDEFEIGDGDGDGEELSIKLGEEEGLGQSDGNGEDSQKDGENIISGGRLGSKPKVQGSSTQKSFDDSIQEQIERGWSNTKDYISIPSVDYNKHVVGWKKVHKSLTEHWKPTELEHHLQYFNKFRKEHMKTVNYLVKEFELKKNADQHARASISKTGVIDVNKLHGYKFNEDLFKRVTTIPGGKNHGLIMFVDFSGSMQGCMQDTIYQLIILTMFCDKVKIPFEVYSFTSTGFTYEDEIDRVEVEIQTAKDKDHYLGYFKLRQYFSSEMRSRELNTAYVNMIGVAENYKDWDCGYSLPDEDQLGSTPLNQCIMTAHKLIPIFQERFNIQKVTSVFLTDGESDHTNEYWKLNEDGDLRRNVYSVSYHGGNVMLHDPVTRIDYECNKRTDITDALIQSIRDRHGIEVIGFYIAESGHAIKGVVYRTTGFWNGSKEGKAIIKKVRQDKSYTIKGLEMGYSEFYIVGGSDGSLKIENEELSLDLEKSRRVRVNAFKKHMKSKTLNKVLLNNFVSIIA